MKKNTTRLLVLALLTVLLCVLAAAGLAAKSHTHEWKLLRTIEKPTCTKAGRGSYRCNCGDIKQDTIPALGHNWNRWTEKKAATCGEDGERTRRCARCGYTLKEKIKATGEHTYKWKTVKKATCGKAGSKQEVCTVCGHKGRTKKIPATGKHKYGDWILTKAATCTETGEETRTCTACGHQETREVKATGHRWDEGTVTKPAGFLEDGEILYTCQNDPAHTKTKGIPAEKPKSGSIMDLFRNGKAKEDPDDGLSLTEETELHIVVQPQNANLYDEEDVRLSCRAAGGEPYDGGTYLYAWYDASGKQVELNDTGDLTVSEEGEYYCTAEDYAGTLLTSDTVTVYNAEPLHVVALSDHQSLKEGETVDLFVQFGGGVPPYEVEWIAQNGGDDPKTQQTADDTWSITVIGNNSNWQFFQCSAIDKMGEHIHSDIIYVVPYRDPLTIVRTEFDPEVTNEKKASLFVEVADGTDPYTYTLLNDGTAQGSKSTHGTNTSFSVDEPGWYAIHIEDSEGRTAQTQYIEVGDSRLKIIEHPQSVEPGFQGKYPTVTFTCKAAGNPDHPLMYQWQGKGPNGWESFPESPKNTITRQEFVVESTATYYYLSSAYRCIVRDTVTGETVTSKEAKVLWPALEVSGYQVGKSTSVVLSVKGGHGPYSISCYRRRASWEGAIGPIAYQENFEVGRYISRTDGGGYFSAEYSVSGISRHDRKYYNGIYNYRHWSYYFTVTDLFGNTATVRIRMQSDQKEAMVTPGGGEIMEWLFDQDTI